MSFILAVIGSLASAAPGLEEGSPVGLPVLLLDPPAEAYPLHEIEGSLRHDDGYCAFSLQSSAPHTAIDLISLCAISEHDLQASRKTPRLFISVDGLAPLEAVYVVDLDQWFSAAAYQSMVEAGSLQSATVEVIP